MEEEKEGKAGVGKVLDSSTRWIYQVDGDFPNQSCPLKNSCVLPELAYSSTPAILRHQLGVPVGKYSLRANRAIAPVGSSWDCQSIILPVAGDLSDTLLQLPQQAWKCDSLVTMSTARVKILTSN